MSEMWREE
jgi:large subunit ribosomal protein L9e